MKRNTYALVLACTLLHACSVRESQEGYPGPGDRLPGFSVTADTGETVTSGDLSRGDVLLAFFNTSCPDCRRELPELQRFLDRNGEGVRVLLISREQDSASIGEYWRENGLTLPYAACTDRAVYSLFAASGIPRTYAVRGGTVLAAWDDSQTVCAEELEQAFR